MGNKDSKDTTQNGDHDVTIIQIQEVHISILADHDAKLTLLIIRVGIQLLASILMVIKKQLKKQAANAAREKYLPVIFQKESQKSLLTL